MVSTSDFDSDNGCSNQSASANLYCFLAINKIALNVSFVTKQLKQFK